MYRTIFGRLLATRLRALGGWSQVSAFGQEETAGQAGRWHATPLAARKKSADDADFRRYEIQRGKMLELKAFEKPVWRF